MTQAVAITKNTAELERLEGIIRRNLQSFYEVGRALMEIRDSGLYRDVLGFDTFEAYCRERWDFTRSYAYRLMDSASVIEVVSPIGDIKPTNESQTRPLARLEPDQQREAWAKAVETAPEGKEKIPLTFLEHSFYMAILEGAIFPGARRGTSERTHPERISVFFYARGTGPSPFPRVGCKPGPSPRRPSRRNIGAARSGGLVL